MTPMGQSTLDRYFKIKNNNLSTKKVKKLTKRSRLSKSKETMKPKSSPKACSGNEVISLVSDDEDQELNCSATTTASSNTTLEYDADIKASPGISQSPSPKKKFYSPTKKRRISMKSPIKAKRNLNVSLETEGKKVNNTGITKDMDDNTTNFTRIICEYLDDRNLKCLMTETSLNLLVKIREASTPAKRIVCRMFWQMEQWCRWKKIKKNASKAKTIDDPTVMEALNYLIDNGLISVARFNGQTHDLDFDQLTKVLYADELKEVCKCFNMKAKTEEAAVQLLRNFMNGRTNITNYFTNLSQAGTTSNNETRALKKLGEKAGHCYKLADEARKTLKELYILMYIGMDYSVIRDNKLELTFLNEKIGQETYPIDSSMVDSPSVIFKSRLEFERYLDAHWTYEEFLVKTGTERCRLIESVFDLYKGIPKEEIMSYATLPVWLRRFTAPNLYMKILEEGIVDLKKDPTNGALVDEILSCIIAQDIFRQHKKAEWISERALVLYKILKDPDEAAKVLLKGLKSLPSEAKALLYPRALLLAKRKTNKIDDQLAFRLTAFARGSATWEKEIDAEHVYKVPENFTGKGKLSFVEFVNGTRTPMDAEAYCIHYYVNVMSTYTHGGHWEGRIVTTLFFLLFWDIIYARLRLPGLFLTRYQSHPLDLYTDSFYSNRKPMIDARLQEIEECTEENLVARMQATWESRPESDVSSGVHRAIGWDNVSSVAKCLGATGVAALCRRLATQYQYAHSGFPDLTLWNVNTKKISFVEVKTDSDKPSMKQKQWLLYLLDCELSARFCYVGVHTRRARARNWADVEYSDDDV
ncbi:fanconi-associated nuclease 1 [Bicyclus anynana]|uniref:Fanconi-associated nuclease n=1 Tax=Bicyclus anynana TaxID=110368 RepID=A0ABM3LXD6_BICAN|nr:fanconi-associated nuclease 1 [Bicyclus anynana]